MSGGKFGNDKFENSGALERWKAPVVDMNVVAEYLLGTTNNLDDGLELVGLTVDTATIEQLQELDGLTMLCDDCGWWCGTEEFNGDEQLCDDCKECE